MTTSPAEVGGADLGIGTEGGGGVFEGDTASLEHIATVGDFEGKASVVVVTSGGIMREQQNFGTCWHNTYRLDCYIFVLYADPNSNWTEANAEDKIDAIEALFADVVMTGTSATWDGTPTYAEQTSLGVVAVGGVSYRRELISILLEKME